jgi:hypothetical protein
MALFYMPLRTFVIIEVRLDNAAVIEDINYYSYKAVIIFIIEGCRVISEIIVTTYYFT